MIKHHFRKPFGILTPEPSDVLFGYGKRPYKHRVKQNADNVSVQYISQYEHIFFADLWFVQFRISFLGRDR